MYSWNEVLDTTKNAKKLVQNSSILNPITRGAIKTIPIVGEILLEMWDQSSSTEDQKISQIIDTLKIIEKGNHRAFRDLCKEFTKNRNEIIDNHDILNQVLFKQYQVLTKINKIDNNIASIESIALINSKKIDELKTAMLSLMTSLGNYKIQGSSRLHLALFAMQKQDQFLKSFKFESTGSYGYYSEEIKKSLPYLCGYVNFDIHITNDHKKFAVYYPTPSGLQYGEMILRSFSNNSEKIRLLEHVGYFLKKYGNEKSLENFSRVIHYDDKRLSLPF